MSLRDIIPHLGIIFNREAGRQYWLLVSVILVTYIPICWFVISTIAVVHSVDTIPLIILSCITLTFFIIVVSVIYGAKLISEYRNTVAEKTRQKSIASYVAQRQLIESLSHDVGPALVICKIIIDKLKELVANGKCKLTGVDDNGTVCNLSCMARGLTPDLDKLFNDLSTAIDRVEEPINSMAATKLVKAGNGTQSLHDLILNAAGGVVRLFNAACTMETIIDGGNGVLNRYAIGRGMTNSDFIAIIHNLVINAKEAGARRIVFTASEVKSTDKFIKLLIADNGTGILDTNGEIVANPDIIFNFGVSTKEPASDIAKNTVFGSIISRLLQLLVPSDSSGVDVVRGSGLFRCREELKKAGGNIRVVATSSVTGTVFEMFVPVKEKVILRTR